MHYIDSNNFISCKPLNFQPSSVVNNIQKFKNFCFIPLIIQHFIKILQRIIRK